jgi:hypothetical protein
MRFHYEIAYELIINGCSSNTNTPFSFTSPLKYLLCDKQFFIAKCLIESGCDLRNEKWILDDKPVIKSNKSLFIDETIIKWIKSYVKSPPTLMSLCRRTIRRNLGGVYLHNKLNLLNIPKDLIIYLQMKQ